MNNTEIKQEIWREVHRIAAEIDPVKIIGVAIFGEDGRLISKSESQQAQNQHRKILKEILKKSNKGEE